MDGYVLTNFFVYAIVNAFTPGPGNILALNTVTSYGWKKGKPLFFWYIHRILCCADDLCFFCIWNWPVSSCCVTGHKYMGTA